jgi:hypothetical protein
MSENRDPIECKSCGTVNAWNAETCRICQKPLSRDDGSEEASATDVVPAATATRGESGELDEDVRTSTPSDQGLPRGKADHHIPTVERRWNVFWIVLGIALHVMIIQAGTFSIIKFFIEPHPELKDRLEQVREAASAGDGMADAKILEETTDEVRSKMNTVLMLFLLLIGLTPILLGAAIGFYTGRILEVAAAMGLSAVLIPLLDNAAAFAVVWGPVNAGLGALGAFLALWFTGRYAFSGRSHASPGGRPPTG